MNCAAPTIVLAFPSAGAGSIKVSNRNMFFFAFCQPSNSPVNGPIWFQFHFNAIQFTSLAFRCEPCFCPPRPDFHGIFTVVKESVSTDHVKNSNLNTRRRDFAKMQKSAKKVRTNEKRLWCRAGEGRGLLTLLTIALPGPIH